METIINYTIGILGLILAIVGIYLTVKSNKKKEPVYSIKSNNLISGSLSTVENLSISYKKHKVESLTVSKILFYNRGAETITRQDIETINPLNISSETCQILDASILQINNPSNNIAIRFHEKSSKYVFVYLDFDYLDQNQGAVIQVIHTGTKSEDLDFFGTMRGVSKLEQVSSDKFITNKVGKENRKQLLAGSLRFMVSLVLLSFIWSYASQLAVLVDALKEFLLVALILTTIMFVGILVITMFTGRTRFFPIIPNSVIPDGLEKFLE